LWRLGEQRHKRNAADAIDPFPGCGRFAGFAACWSSRTQPCETIVDGRSAERGRLVWADAFFPLCSTRTEPLTERRVAHMRAAQGTTQGTTQGHTLGPVQRPSSLVRRCNVAAEQGAVQCARNAPGGPQRSQNLQGALLRPNARAQPRLGNRAPTAAALGSMPQTQTPLNSLCHRCRT
jgi:hypothetical protein